MIFGFAILAVMAIITIVIAIGKVEQATSYGLDIALGSLATLAGGFAQWAFSGRETKAPTDSSNVIGGSK